MKNLYLDVFLNAGTLNLSGLFSFSLTKLASLYIYHFWTKPDETQRFKARCLPPSYKLVDNTSRSSKCLDVFPMNSVLVLASPKLAKTNQLDILIFLGWIIVFELGHHSKTGAVASLFCAPSFTGQGNATLKPGDVFLQCQTTDDATNIMRAMGHRKYDGRRGPRWAQLGRLGTQWGKKNMKHPLVNHRYP